MVTIETKQDIKQAVIEAKWVVDQLQVMAGQLDRLADQLLSQTRKNLFKCENNNNSIYWAVLMIYQKTEKNLSSVHLGENCKTR